MKTKILLSLLLFTGNCFGQVMFQKVFTSKYKTDEAYVATQTSDGGYIVAGDEGDSSGYNIWLIKLDANGDTLWTKTFSNSDQVPVSVQQTLDGGYIITGGYYNIYLIRTNSIGDTLWTKTYGVPSGFNIDTHGNVVKQTADSGFVIGGSSSSLGSGDYDYLLIKTDKMGDTLWSKCYGTYDNSINGGANDDILNDMQETSDGGYIMAGTRFLHSNFTQTALIIKTDSLGNPVWNNVYGDTIQADYHSAKSVRQTLDGGYIIYDGKPGLPSIFKIDFNGAIQWIKNIVGYYPIIPTRDGGYALAVAGGLVKTDSTGDTLWIKNYIYDFSPISIEQVSDSGFILSGSIVEDSLGYIRHSPLVKTDVNGNSVCNISHYPYLISGIPSLQILDSSIIVTLVSPLLIDSAIIVENTVMQTTLCLDLAVSKTENENLITIFPNPAQNELTIKTSDLRITKPSIYIINTLGQIISPPATLLEERGDAVIDISNLPSGMYFVKIAGDKELWTGKFVKE